jgi:Protein of unknown function (DUF2829)
MEKYIGVKLINAKPMTRGAYSNLRGWTLTPQENPSDEGYLVEYNDGGKANHPDFSGYISWSPKAVFEKSYLACDGLTFGLAVEALKLGYKVSRAGWNGKGMWLAFVGGTEANGRNAYAIGLLPTPEFLSPWIGIKNANNHFVPWVASQTDVLADDWAIITEVQT